MWIGLNYSNASAEVFFELGDVFVAQLIEEVKYGLFAKVF